MNDTSPTVATPGASRSPEIRGVLANVAALHPAYFALVMATGIVSIAAQLKGFPTIGVVLFGLNCIFYALLCVLTGIRIARFPQNMFRDLLDHGRCVGFFTTVAGTCVLGSQCFVIGASPRIASILWFLGIALWALLSYAIFTALIVKSEKPPLERGINGGWLVAVVATQSVSVLGTQLASFFQPQQELVLFFTLTMWLGGGMLYIWIISLVFYRYTFFAMEPSDLSPPYWINMGSMAISTLAGAFLITAVPLSPLLQQVLPFLRGFTLFFWATATGWIPMLLILGIWRHIFRRFPLRYDPMYWGAVFPLGMYATCTFRLAQAMDASFIAGISSVFLWIAFSAWIAVFLGLLRRIARVLAYSHLPQS